MNSREQYPYTWAMLDLFDSVEEKLKPIREEAKEKFNEEFYKEIDSIIVRNAEKR